MTSPRLTPLLRWMPDMEQQQIQIAPAGMTLDTAPGGYRGDYGHTRQAFWYRMRAQDAVARRQGAHLYALSLDYFDNADRLWKHDGVAVMDDYGSLVEVPVQRVAVEG